MSAPSIISLHSEKPPYRLKTIQPMLLLSQPSCDKRIWFSFICQGHIGNEKLYFKLNSFGIIGWISGLLGTFGPLRGSWHTANPKSLPLHGLPLQDLGPFAPHGSKSLTLRGLPLRGLRKITSTDIFKSADLVDLAGFLGFTSTFSVGSKTLYKKNHKTWKTISMTEHLSISRLFSKALANNLWRWVQLNFVRDWAALYYFLKKWLRNKARSSSETDVEVVREQIIDDYRKKLGSLVNITK